jgi:hypothetical protein
MAARRDEAVSDALDRLYSAPLDAFMALRRELVASLRAKGDPQAAQAAREVGAAPKPTRTAWALDQVAHRKPQLVRALLDARDAAAETQKRGEGDAIRAAVREYRTRTTEVTHAARDALIAAGFGVTASQLRRMSETLATASVEGSDARTRLAAGWLTEDVGQEDPFAGIEAGPARAPKARRDTAPVREDARVGAAAAAREKAEAAAREKAEAVAREKTKHEAARKAAQERVHALEAEVRDARAEARRRETAALRASDEADRARRALEEAESRLGNAREALRAMRA